MRALACAIDAKHCVIDISMTAVALLWTSEEQWSCQENGRQRGIELVRSIGNMPVRLPSESAVRVITQKTHWVGAFISDCFST